MPVACQLFSAIYAAILILQNVVIHSKLAPLIHHLRLLFHNLRSCLAVSSIAMYENVIAGASLAPGTGYLLPITLAVVFPAAYSPIIGLPSSASTCAKSSVNRPPFVPRSPGYSLTAMKGASAI